MPSPKSPIVCLMLLPLLLVASGCQTPAAALQTYPPAEDLRVERKPAPPDEIVTSAQAAARYNIAVETWGERGWATVGRVCLWAKVRGFHDAPC